MPDGKLGLVKTCKARAFAQPQADLLKLSRFQPLEEFCSEQSERATTISGPMRVWSPGAEADEDPH